MNNSKKDGSMKWCLFSVSFVLILASCSTFVKVAHTTVQEKDFGYIKTSNATLNFSSLSYADIKYALNSEEYKKLRKGKSPFKHILVYGVATEQPYYEFWVLVGSPQKAINKNNYWVKEKEIDEQLFTLVASKTTPQEDFEFLAAEIKKAITENAQ
ncbi:MAG TPA: hypothetical protein PKN22_00090 [Taishania sp.]|nr:hypothetical protein [Taishania sp.]